MAAEYVMQRQDIFPKCEQKSLWRPGIVLQSHDIPASYSEGSGSEYHLADQSSWHKFVIPSTLTGKYCDITLKQAVSYFFRILPNYFYNVASIRYPITKSAGEHR
jgi:hypothetical protein